MTTRPSDPARFRAWIGEGSTLCTHCLQGYSLEVEVHCHFCDRPGCPHCLVLVKGVGGGGCPDCRCHEEADAPSGGPG